MPLLLLLLLLRHSRSSSSSSSSAATAISVAAAATRLRRRPGSRRRVHNRLDLRHGLQPPRRGLQSAQQRRVQSREPRRQTFPEPRVRSDLCERHARRRVGRQQPPQQVQGRGRNVGGPLVLGGDDAGEHLLEADEVVGALVASLGEGEGTCFWCFFEDR